MAIAYILVLAEADAALRQALQGQNIPDTMRRLDADPRVREIVLGKISQDDAQRTQPLL